ncbi:MAG: hypothetical protein ACK2T4_04950 [Candidatus Promineifilaceae bacterium]|jgi:hypothetical protein
MFVKGSVRGLYLKFLLLIMGVLLVAAPLTLFAQGNEPVSRVQVLEGRLEPIDTMEIYLLEGLQAGDTLYVTMQAISGDLDPILSVLDGSTDVAAAEVEYKAQVQNLLATEEDLTLALNDLRDRTFLGWDDDGGEGYGAALEFPIPASGDYMLVAGSALSSVGRTTSGDYRLTIGINAPEVLTGDAQPAGEPFASLDRHELGFVASVSEETGVLTPEQPLAVLDLVDMQPGDTFYAFVEAVEGDFTPQVILRDFGDKPVQAANVGGEEPAAVLEFTMPEEAVGYTLEIASASGSDQLTSGKFRALLGLNASEVRTGQASVSGSPLLKKAAEVQVGVKIDRISEVDSAGENFTVIGSVRMDWQDPNLAFSPDSCNCDMKLYTEKEFDDFLAEASSRWPDFSFFNQLGNRWIQNRAVAVWPDGQARYVERFSTTFQADFEFQKFPFDSQQFPVMVDMILPEDVYKLVELPGYSEISPDHGEDEFIVGEFKSAPYTVIDSAGADRPVSRMTFFFDAPRHLNYYVLQIFVPILLIIAISWFTFFLKDYTRRIEAAAANILLFIAFNFSLASNYPRLGYITFLDAIMAVTFIVNVLVLLYNVQMKRLEMAGMSERVEKIDNVLDWAYPVTYLVLIGVVAYFFLFTS